MTATHSERLPTLLHFAAQNGLRGLASVLLRCPGVKQALRLPNQHGDTPLKLAQKHGHAQLGALLQEVLVSAPRVPPPPSTASIFPLRAARKAARFLSPDRRKCAFVSLVIGQAWPRNLRMHFSYSTSTVVSCSPFMK